MSEDNFSQAIAYVLQNEGGYVDRTNDLGGPTNFGITLAILDKYRNTTCTSGDIFNLSKDEAIKIYKDFFWSELQLEELPLDISTAILDTAVNEGGPEAIKLAQQAVGSHVTADGKMGPNTLTALKETSAHDFVINYIGAIQERYIDIVTAKANQISFLRGWLRRSRRLMRLL